ncbi:MAG: type IV pilus twitching motility protein PilT [Armatimonadota bacterium]
MAAPNIDDLLRFAVQQDASDLHIKADSPPLLRIYGDLIPMKMAPLTREEAKAITYSILNDRQIARFEDELEFDLAYEIPDLCRFRVNCFVQRGNIQSVYRAIPFRISTMEELGLPDLCRRAAERPRGLVLVTGPAGSGKSTTLAAMIDYINTNIPCHIVTVEDPLEFIHTDKQAVINQRELGEDTHSFANALKFVLRQDPDVILVGEMRDLETIGLAITAAETGHLVLATLHTKDAVQTVDRVIDVFPTHQQQQVRMQVSVNLVAVISQTLVKRADGQGRVAAFETMEAIPAVRSLIREAKTHQIGSIVQTGAKRGMYTLDQSLAHLVRQGVVTYEDAYDKASVPTEFEAIVREAQAEAAAEGGQPPEGGYVQYQQAPSAEARYSQEAATQQPPPAEGM